MIPKIEPSKERKVLFVTIAISLVMIIIGVISGDPGVLGNIIILSVFFISIPQAIFSYINYKEVKDMELNFPRFLRDLVESTRAGLPLHKAIASASKTDYGPLSKEIKKMSDQLSWNVSIITVLEHLMKRLKRSQSLVKTIRVIIETYKSGGSTQDTLQALSETLSTIQETQKERKSMLNQYVVAMYALTFAFIIIVIGINKFMIPIFKSAIPGGEGPLGEIFANPCEVCKYTSDVRCVPCKVYSQECGLFGVNREGVSCYYFGLFVSIAIVQSITGGLVTGQIGEGSVKAGLKHSILMLVITVGLFLISVKLGLLGG